MESAEDREKREAEGAEEKFDPPPALTAKEKREMDQGSNRQITGFKLDNPMLKMGLVALAVSLIVVLVTSSMGIGNSVSKSDFNTNLGNISTDIGTINTEQTAQQAAQAAAKVALEAQIAAVKAEISVLTGKVNSFTGEGVAIGTLNAKVATLEGSLASIQSSYSNYVLTPALDTAVAGIKGQITALEKLIAEQPGVTPETETDGIITAKVKSMNNVMVATDNKTLVTQFKIELTNTTAKDVEDIILTIYAETGVTYGSIQSFTLTGGGTNWQGYGWGADAREFVNSQWGLNVDANKTKTLYLTMTIVGDSSSAFDTRYLGGVGYNVDVSVE